MKIFFLFAAMTVMTFGGCDNKSKNIQSENKKDTGVIQNMDNLDETIIGGCGSLFITSHKNPLCQTNASLSLHSAILFLTNHIL